MTASIGSHCGSFGKGGPDLREPCHKLAAQRRVVDLALNGPRAQDLLFVSALFCGRLACVLFAVDRIRSSRSNVLPRAFDRKATFRCGPALHRPTRGYFAGFSSFQGSLTIGIVAIS